MEKELEELTPILTHIRGNRRHDSLPPETKENISRSIFIRSSSHKKTHTASVNPFIKTAND